MKVWALGLLIILAGLLLWFVRSKMDTPPKPAEHPEHPVMELVEKWQENHPDAYFAGLQEDKTGAMVTMVVVADHVEIWHLVFEVRGYWFLDHIFCTGC